MEPLFVDIPPLSDIQLHNFGIHQPSAGYFAQNAPRQQPYTNSALQSPPLAVEDFVGDLSCAQVQTITEEELNQLLRSAEQYHVEPAARVSRVLAFDEEPEQHAGTYQELATGSKHGEVPNYMADQSIDQWLYDLPESGGSEVSPVDEELQLNVEQQSAAEGSIPAFQMSPSTMSVLPRYSALAETPKPRTQSRPFYVNSSLVCDSCGRTFGRRSGLTQHRLAHHSGPREHRCDDCGKRFHDLDLLHRHVQRHVIQDKRFKCTSCPRQFNFEWDLRRHIVTRHGLPRHGCETCGKRFARRDHLLSHEAVHRNRKQRTEAAVSWAVE